MMKIAVLFSTACILAFIGFTNCSKSTSSSPPNVPAPTTTPTVVIVPKGTRLLGLHLSEPQSGFNTGFASASQIKFDVINLHFPWGIGNFSGSLPVSPLETNSSAGCTSASTYDTTYLGYARAFYPTHGTKVNLTIGTYDGPNKFMPACSANMAFDSSTVQTMFNYLLDTAFAELNTSPQLELQSLVIGNEIDLHTDFQSCQVSPQLSASWQHYKAFFDNQRTHARTLRPNLKVGVTGSFNGLTNPSLQPCFAELLANADFISVTYYPMDSSFRMKSADVVFADFAKIIQMYPGKEIYFQEVGYSSGSTYIGSSETQQSQFYTYLFQAWDQNSSAIKMVSIVNLHEWADATVDGFGTQYGLCPGSLCNGFKEYLKTLGLRTYPNGGTDKPAFETVKTESQARGWN